jgi:hypothetical protein
MSDEKQPAINKGIFSDKEIFCIARHMQRYVDALIHRYPHVPGFCHRCPRIPECAKTSYRMPSVIMSKLKQITHVYIRSAKEMKR